MLDGKFEGVFTAKLNFDGLTVAVLVTNNNAAQDCNYNEDCYLNTLGVFISSLEKTLLCIEV